MACQRYQESLIDLALGALEGAREKELRTHLENCAACREQFVEQQHLAAAIDRGIAASVSAEPSPEFTARIRQRIAAEPGPVASWWEGFRPGWLPIAAGALAILVLAIWFMRRAPSPLQPIPSPEVAHSQPPSIQVPEALPPDRHTAGGRAHPRVAPHDAGTVPPRRPEPEIIVPAGQERAVLQLYAAIRSGRADAASLIAAPASLEIPELKIAPLEVKPLSEGGSDTGNGGPGR